MSSFKGIKSSYILRDIFSLIKENRKLKIAIYSKKLKERLEILLDDYIKESGFIIVIEKPNKYFLEPEDEKLIKEGTGKGKVYLYDEKILIFEGNFRKYIKEGFGTEYFLNGKKRFDGQYSNGKKINGKRYDKRGNIILRWENGIYQEKFRDNKIKFIGEYKEDKKWTGKGYDDDGNQVYEIKEGKGKVIEYYDDGKKKFEGEYQFGERNGQGIKYDHQNDITFQGIYKNGEKWTGKGVEYFTEDDDKDKLNFAQFFGKPKKKKKRGLFSFEKKDNYNLSGLNFRFGDDNSPGKDYNAFGFKSRLKIKKYEGEYLNGKRHGNGKEYSDYLGTEQLKFEGQYKNGLRNGFGKEYDPSQMGVTAKANIIYEGEFLNGNRHGKGIIYEGYFSKKAIDVEYNNGKRVK